MEFKRQEVVEKLTKKFSFVPRGADHKAFDLEVEGVMIASTHLSDGGKKGHIGDVRQLLMGRDMHLTKSQFCAGIECSLTREQYYDLLADRNPSIADKIRAAGKLSN